MHSRSVQLKRQRSTGSGFHLRDVIRVVMLATEYVPTCMSGCWRLQNDTRPISNDFMHLSMLTFMFLFKHLNTPPTPAFHQCLHHGIYSIADKKGMLKTHKWSYMMLHMTIYENKEMSLITFAGSHSPVESHRWLLPMVKAEAQHTIEMTLVNLNLTLSTTHNTLYKTEFCEAVKDSASSP